MYWRALKCVYRFQWSQLEWPKCVIMFDGKWLCLKAITTLFDKMCTISNRKQLKCGIKDALNFSIAFFRRKPLTLGENSLKWCPLVGNPFKTIVFHKWIKNKGLKQTFLLINRSLWAKTNDKRMSSNSHRWNFDYFTFTLCIVHSINHEKKPNLFLSVGVAIDTSHFR